MDLKATISSLQDKIIQKLLSNRRRVFFDIRKPENNVRLIGLIDNEYKRKTFTNGLEKILANYPKSVGQEEVRVKEILKYFANICGVSTQTQPGWFYYIAGDDGAIWSLTLRTESEEWYTFMASDSFISVERCLPTEKHIIGLWGSAGTGKTPTMHKVFRLLQKNYSKHSVVLESDARYDVKGLFFIGNAKIGVEGQGDPNSRQQNSIAEFVSIGCDIIIISSRTLGMTVDAIDRFGGMYKIAWEEKKYEYNENLHEAINQAQAEDLVQKIEQFAAAI